MAVTADTLRLQENLRTQLQRVTDQQTRDLVGAWADAWDEIAPDLRASLDDALASGTRVTRAQLLRNQRLQSALRVVADYLADLNTRSRDRVLADLSWVIDQAGAAQARIIDSQLPAVAQDLVNLSSWARVDEEQVAAIVRRTTEQITARHYPLAADAYQVVRRELIRGVAAGTNPRATARRMIARAERVGFNGGLTRALTIARTETLDAHRAAAAVGQGQHADVLRGWSWLAVLDSRTCSSCWAQHGSIHPTSEPGPFDHHQGRCSRVPVTKSWADLGIEIPEPPSLIPDAADTFRSLTTPEQLEILGPARHAAWVRGDYPMSSWSERRSTPGWRDSYVRSAAPSVGRSSRSAA